MWHQTNGIPVEGFEPSPYGPPRGSEAYPFEWQAAERDLAVPARTHAVSYHPVTLPPVKSRRARSINSIRSLAETALLAVALLLITGVLVALLSVRGVLAPGTGTHSSTSRSVPPSLATTAGPECKGAVRSTLSSPPLTGVQLTTGLRDSAHHDYHPVNVVSSFHVGQRGYITFEITTDQAGAVAVRFCLPSRVILGTLQVPGHSQGRFGEFAMDFTKSDIGQGEAVLFWDDEVTATVKFTVQAA